MGATVNDERATAHIPHAAHEVAWARWRPKPHRTPIPAVGDRILYRANAWFEPVEATVLDVTWHTDDHDITGSIDWNCWRVRTVPETAQPVYDSDGQMIIDKHPDAWPTLLLKIEGQVSHVQTREARLRGSAGWLPLDWQTRQRPVPGKDIPR